VAVEKSIPAQHEFLAAEEWETWTALMMLHRVVVQRLDGELRRHHGLAVTEFDVLITLFNAPDNRLGMSALAQRVLLSPAGATHLVTRLERDRMVRREVDPTDRRKWYAVLTEQGDALLRSARRTHDEVLRQTLLALTTPTERRTLGRLWRRLAERQPHPLTAVEPDR
jgi:DNA-binding MarR family transcriptional regulator